MPAAAGDIFGGLDFLSQIYTFSQVPLKANCQLEGYGSGEGLEDKSISDKRATLCKPHEEGTLQSKLL